MSYLVLARKWRPKNFSEVVGQDHAVEALRNSISSKSSHHAYLFTGTRGVGKTSIARILAKALNCSNINENGEPCNECDSCNSINNGASIDFIEIDSESRRGIEDTKNLLETISYLPASSKYKVYLIDEVHMLTPESFNALLKNLEEPPAHVIFMFATTEYKKILPTIISRCLQVNLSSVGTNTILDHLKKIFKMEKISHDKGSLLLIAEAAKGSIRDALSISEKVISYCNKNLNENDVRNILGIPEPKILSNLLTSIIDEDPEELLKQLESYGEYEDHESLLQGLMDLIQVIAVNQFENKKDNEINDNLISIDPSKLQFLYQIGLSNLNHFSTGYDSYSIIKMTLLKMVAFSKEHQKKNSKPSDNESTQTEDLSWPKIFNELNINGMPKKILRQASVQKSNRKLLISLPEKMFSILNDNQKKDIEICFNDYFREELKFSYDTKVDSSLTPENEDQIKDKGLKKNIKNSIEKDSSYKEIVGGLKIEKVKFNKKNET